MGCVARLLWLLTLFSAAVGPAPAADIKVINRDGRLEGFRDRSPPDVDSAIGLNRGATLGRQRLIAFRAAAAIWAERIQSSVQIRIDARFNADDPDLPCDASSAVLGAAGPNSAHRDFLGARIAKTWYVQALANALAGRDLAPGQSDIDAEFNSDVGTTCAFPDVWYYGLDGRPPGTKIDFVTVALHELGHGLGFLSLVDLKTGERFKGLNDIYMRRLQNTSTGRRYPEMTDRERVRASSSGRALRWTGGRVVAASTLLGAGVDRSGRVRMYAPRPQEPGSSVSHFSTSLFPNQLLEPMYTGPDHVPDLELPLLLDLGWKPAGADLSIVVVDTPDPVPQGGTLTYDITVLNGGPGAATNVTLTDILPGGVGFVSASPSQGTCTGTATVICTLGEVANGAAVTVSTQVLANVVGSLTNSAAVSAERDSNPANNTAAATTTVNGVPPALP
ncbi:MAG: DUF11 domain-containing protein [Gammaproteobacteria bacterium]|nr:DUF11 domain-containing protein [Gammaproteobacteria bacterium]